MVFRLSKMVFVGQAAQAVKCLLRQDDPPHFKLQSLSHKKEDYPRIIICSFEILKVMEIKKTEIDTFV